MQKWVAGRDATRQISFQIVSGGAQGGALLTEHEDLARSGEADLAEGHGAV